jgi:hypothetical protein
MARCSIIVAWLTFSSNGPWAHESLLHFNLIDTLFYFTMDSDDSDDSAPTLYIPDVLQSELDSGDSLEDINARLKQKNWLTTALVDEITSLFPSAADVDTTTGERDKAKFVENCEILFPPGRIFCSYKQLDQVAKMFLEAWAISKSHNGKKISCHLGELPVKRNKKPPKNRDFTPRVHGITLKQQTKYPFEINYSWIGLQAVSKKPGIFYHVKITKVNTEHTCRMNTSKHRHVIQRQGHLELSVSGMKDIISIISEKPEGSNPGSLSNDPQVHPYVYRNFLGLHQQFQEKGSNLSLLKSKL